MNWTSEWFRPADDAAIERLAEQTVRLVLHGVAAPSGARSAAATARDRSRHR